MKDVFLPAGDKPMVYTQAPGGEALATGKANYKEFWYAMAGLAGESQNFDGNGAFIRTAERRRQPTP